MTYSKSECDNVLQPFTVWAATHYRTRALQTLIHGKECFILLLQDDFQASKQESKRLQIYKNQNSEKTTRHLEHMLILTECQNIGDTGPKTFLSGPMDQS